MIRHCDIQSENSQSGQPWKQSRILYSQLLSNTETPKPPNGVKDIGLELFNHLSYERALGPHLWFQLKVSKPPEKHHSSNETSYKSQHEILACGTLPLVYKEDTT